MMTTLDGISRLAQLIQQRVGKGPTHAAATSNTGASSRAAAGSSEPAFTTLIDRVGTIADDDPDRERKAFRYFLEAALLSDLGMQLVNDPKFHSLVDTVQQRMEGQPALREAVTRASSLLLQMKE